MINPKHIRNNDPNPPDRFMGNYWFVGVVDNGKKGKGLRHLEFEYPEILHVIQVAGDGRNQTLVLLPSFYRIRKRFPVEWFTGRWWGPIRFEADSYEP